MYLELSTSLSSSGSPTKCGKVDGTSERGLSAVFDISGFPTLYYVSPDNKSIYKYRGSRSVQALTAYVGGGFREDSPLSFWTGPFGIVGRMKWGLLHIGGIVWKLYGLLEPKLGMWAAGAVVGVGGMITMSVGIVGCMVWCQNQITKQQKRD